MAFHQKSFSMKCCRHVIRKLLTLNDGNIATKPQCSGFLLTHYMTYTRQAVCSAASTSCLKLTICGNNALYNTNNLRLVRAASTEALLRASLTNDINIEELKADIKKRSKGGNHVHTVKAIKEVVLQRCNEAIDKLSEEDKKKLKVIQLEHNFLYSEGHFIPPPEEMTSEYWLEALSLPTKPKRLRFYEFVMKKKQIKLNEKEKKKEKEEDDRPKNPMNSYEHGKIFMRIYESTMKRWLNYILANSMQYGQPLVIDMDYLNHMRPQEIKNTVSQLVTLYTMNRADPQRNPFHLHFTSCPEDHSMYRLMQMELQENEHFLATVTGKSYLDIFDKKSLVYLSPDAKQEMRSFDPEAVYIIGAFNDKATQQPVSAARAKKQGIRCMRLPLDKYLNWNVGTKNLPLNHLMGVMACVKNGLPWEEALKSNLPKRKIRE